MASQPDSAALVIAKAEAKRSATLVQGAALAGACVCIALAGMLQPPINQRRRELELVMSPELAKALPPKYAWVSAAGGAFRGIAVDLLWMRAEALKQEGKYYEAHQLAKWICTLQPRFADVWAFQSWNMSYNISVGTHTREERWRWVYNGIRLLRDEGIPNNPRAVGLYHQMAWIWFHKVGQHMDDMHRYYKRAWAARMETLLGPPPTGATAAEEVDWFRPVGEAPRTLEALIEAHPGVRKLVDDLDDMGVDVTEGTASDRLFHPLEERFFRAYTLHRLDQSSAALRREPVERSEAHQKLVKWLTAAPEVELDALLAYLRAKVLREQYKMDAAYMLGVTGRLGTDEPMPLDWRTPWSQCIYWGLYGTDQSRDVLNPDESAVLNTDRILLFSLQYLFRNGRVLFRLNPDKPMESYLAFMPDMRFIDAMHEKYKELGEKYREEGENVENRTAEVIRSGHVNFLEEALVDLYYGGREEEAQNYLNYLAKHYPNPYTGQKQAQYFQNVKDFVRTQVGDLATREVSQALILLIARRAYMNLAGGDGEAYTAAVGRAYEVYQAFQSEHADSREGRMSLLPFDQLLSGALIQFISDPSLPVHLRSMVWNRVNPEVQQWCWDAPEFVSFILEECDRSNIAQERAFPEPPGMEEWRRTNKGWQRQEDFADDLREKQKAQDE